jgi:hypothetical protein
MAAAIFWGLPDGCCAEPVPAAELGDGDGDGVAAAAARSAASLAARRAERRSAARSARTRLTPSLATSRRATPISGIPVPGCAEATLAAGCDPAMSSSGDELPAVAPEVVSPATTAAGTITVTPATATVILDNLRLCVNRLRFFLCRADTNNLWSGALCARLHPGHCRPMTRPGQGQRRADVTQVQGDASLGATITHAGCCQQTIVPGGTALLRQN